MSVENVTYAFQNAATTAAKRRKIEAESLAEETALRLRKLLAEAKSIFTLVAYRRAAKFADNQSERADNSYGDREHERDPDGRKLTKSKQTSHNF